VFVFKNKRLFLCLAINDNIDSIVIPFLILFLVVVGVDSPTDPAILVLVSLSLDHYPSGYQFTVVPAPGTISVLPTQVDVVHVPAVIGV
jgi:hypothetical protein